MSTENKKRKFHQLNGNQTCIAAGSVNQAHSKFKAPGRQCTAMAYVAAIYSTIRKRSMFSKQDVDFILNEGDNLYVKLEPYIPTSDTTGYLNPDDLPSTLQINQTSVEIEDMTDLSSVNQAHSKFKAPGRQCTAMAYVAAIYSTIRKRSMFSKQDVDFILNEGDNLYVKLEPYIPTSDTTGYLNPDDLPSTLQINQTSVEIEDMTDLSNCLVNGEYPKCIGEIEDKLLYLLNKLTEEVFNANHNDVKDSYLFIGNGYTVSFWRHNGKYYYFNSHSVNSLNEPVTNGVARFFKCNNIADLAKLLLSYQMSINPLQTRFYGIYKVRVLNLPSNQESSNLIMSDVSQHSEISPISIHNVSILETMDSVVEFSEVSPSIIKSSQIHTQTDINKTDVNETISLINNEIRLHVSKSVDYTKISDDATISLIDSSTQSDISHCIDNTNVMDNTTITIVDSGTQSDNSNINHFMDNTTISLFDSGTQSEVHKRKDNIIDDTTMSLLDMTTQSDVSQYIQTSPTILTNYNNMLCVNENLNTTNLTAMHAAGNACNEIFTSTPKDTHISNTVQADINNENMINKPTISLICSDTQSDISENNNTSPLMDYECFDNQVKNIFENSKIKAKNTMNVIDNECSLISPSILQDCLSPGLIKTVIDNELNCIVQPIVNEYNITSPSIINDIPDFDLGMLISGNINSKNIKINNPEIKSDKKLTILKPVVVIDRQSILDPVYVVACKKSKTSLSSNKRGRPMKKKRGRKKIKPSSHLDAVIKYTEKNPKVHRDAVKKYTDKNLEVHRDSVKKYADKNPEINRDAVKKYTDKNPEVHRNAVKKYADKNPKVNLKAVKKYTVKNPDVHREAVKKYTEKKPEVHRTAVDKYYKKNPEVNRAAVRNYHESHPEITGQTETQYNEFSRNIEVPLRRSKNLIGEKRGAELSTIVPFSLKNVCLYSSDAYVCPHCSARLFDEEKTRKQWCCGSGANNVQAFASLTEDFYTHPAFVKRPRAYNNMFAFSALGTTHGQHQPDGIAFLKIQGRIYHRVFDLTYNKTTNNIAMHINDSSERESIAAGENLEIVVIRSITNFLHNVNPYIECFKRLSLEASSEAFIQFEKTSRATHGNILGDQPVGREVSAIISTDREQYAPRSIAVWKIGESKPHTVDIMHILYECFQYPLLYPEGNPGWYPGRLDNFGKKLTQAKYVRCLLLSLKRFSECGRLSEEWIVDMYCRIREERFRYMFYMQSQNRSNELRVAPLQELLNDETIIAEGISPGRIYLPNSFTGGPRYMKGKYLDGIALFNRRGRPTYFMTLTCNPNWIEIRRSTPPGQRPNPLICARAFKLRLDALIRDIRSGHWFGKVEYLMYVIEFQKRGLPHAHICFRVEGGGPVDNVDIDKVCRADIPDESEDDGRLREAVLEHMIHGPCGPDRDNLPCYDKENKKCTKRFPKRETDVTFTDERGFVHLRRNSKNVATIKYRGREITVNDLWVVPYNAALLLKYDAHLNVEVASQRSIIKYLFKYMTKGPDEARVAIVTDNHNEIEEYATKAYIGSSDAVWRILEFDVTAREPNVKQLPVHLENQQTVYFRPSDINEAVSRGGSDLITYFNRPQGEEFDSVKYIDFYENYIVHTKRPTTKTTQIYETQNGKFITPRQRGELVARMFWVAPNRGEQFYLRILLNSFPCRSYKDLLRLGGEDCTTFQEAAKAVGLADDLREYEMALAEASTFFTGHRLRNFFVLLAVNGAPVASMWETFKKQLSEDILHRMPNEETRAYNLCLTQIGRLLRKHGSTLMQQGLPDVHDDTTELGRERVEYNINTQKSFVNEWVSKLSSEQRAVFDYTDKLCVDKQYREMNPCAIFIDGPAGTGKTLLLNVITAHVRGDLSGIVLCTASSAIAAQNHEGGITAHSMFKYPLDLDDDNCYWNITNGTQRAELIYHADVILYDEAPMAHKYLIHLLDRSLRDLMKSDKIFGGKIIIFAGDFRQIPPVVPSAKTNSDILNSSVKTSPLWRKLKTFSLIASQRCRDDPEYAEFLLNLGSNNLSSVPLQSGAGIQRLISLESIELVSDLDELIDFVFGLVLDEPDVCTHRAILCTRNDAVREINATILERVPGEILHFYSNDKVVNDNADQLFLGPDVLNRIQPPGVPEFDLKLKEGCVCMIIRNLSFADGLVNGTKVIIESTSPRLITVRKPGGHENYLIPRILFKAPIDKNSPFEMSRRQFPLQLCYAMTIHKSQGQTIGRVGVDLRSDVFSHGQLYVALGRVREKRNIKILLHKDRIVNGNPLTINKIIPELL